MLITSVIVLACCPGVVSHVRAVVPVWCPGVVSRVRAVVPVWCPGVVSRWWPGGVPMVSQWCPGGGVPVVMLF